MKCDEHILLRFLASSVSLSHSLPPALSPFLSLSVVATVPSPCATLECGKGATFCLLVNVNATVNCFGCACVTISSSLLPFACSSSPPFPSLSLCSSVFQLHHSSMTIKTIRGRCCCCCFCWPNTSQQIVVITAPVAFRLSLPDVIMSVFVPSPHPSSFSFFDCYTMLNVAYNYGKSCMKQQTATTTTKRFIFSYELKSFCCAFVFAIAIDAVRKPKPKANDIE